MVEEQEGEEGRVCCRAQEVLEVFPVSVWRQTVQENQGRRDSPFSSNIR